MKTLHQCEAISVREEKKVCFNKWFLCPCNKTELAAHSLLIVCIAVCIFSFVYNKKRFLQCTLQELSTTFFSQCGAHSQLSNPCGNLHLFCVPFLALVPFLQYGHRVVTRVLKVKANYWRLKSVMERTSGVTVFCYCWWHLTHV